MKISEIIKYADKPNLYEKGTAQMWTDKHISKQLLDVHLNDDVDLASRKVTTIDKTVNWILNQVTGNNLKILDLGCGPGLYTEKLASKGHEVTGVDFSENSIEYAKQQAENKGLKIQYIQKNYLELDFEDNSYDLIMLIFTDFGVLIPEERTILLNSIKRMLKPDGVFIMDVLNDNCLENKQSPKTGEVAPKGFWRDKPYLSLFESFFYEEEKVMLNQHLIMDESNNLEVYRFWIHFFSPNDLRNILGKFDFKNIQFAENVLPKGDIWSGENVTFCIISK